MDEVSSHDLLSKLSNCIFDHREPLKVFKIVNNVEKLFEKIWIFYIIFDIYASCEEEKLITFTHKILIVYSLEAFDL